MTSQDTKTIVMLAFDGCNIVDVSGPTCVFGTAQYIEPYVDRDQAPYRVLLCSPNGDPIETSAGVKMLPDASLSSLDFSDVDTLLVAGGKGVHEAAKRSALIRSVKTAATKVRRLASVCTGAFILAEAGLLDGRTAVTHWNACEELATRYPVIEVDPTPIFIEDDGVYSSAGVTAGMDLALAMVAADLGRDASLAIAKDMVMFVTRPGGQDQFSSLLQAQMARPGRIRDVQIWAHNNLRADLGLDALAQYAAMSTRTFVRRFKQETGTSPAQYISRLRLDAARALLEQSNLQVSEIAEYAGFGDMERMRRTFQRMIRTSPENYRARFTVRN